MKETIERYLKESKAADKAKYPSHEYAVISSNKIATITGFDIDVVEEFLKTCELADFIRINGKYKIYRLL